MVEFTNNLQVTETLSSVTALLPGNKVEALILASHKNGLTCLIQGLYEATINRIHLNLEGMESPVDYYKLGNTVNLSSEEKIQN